MRVFGPRKESDTSAVGGSVGLHTPMPRSPAVREEVEGVSNGGARAGVAGVHDGRRLLGV